MALHLTTGVMGLWPLEIFYPFAVRVNVRVCQILRSKVNPRTVRVNLLKKPFSLHGVNKKILVL